MKVEVGPPQRAAGVPRERARQLVERWLPMLTWALQLREWEVNVVLWRADEVTGDSPDGHTLGACELELDHLVARITIDPDAARSEADLAATLVHELLHLLAAPYQVAFEQAQAALGDDHPAMAALDRAWAHASERAVAHLERMLSVGLGMKPEALVEIPPLGANGAPEGVRTRGAHARRR